MKRRFIVAAALLLVLGGSSFGLAQEAPLATNALGTPCAQPGATPSDARPASPVPGASPISSPQGTPAIDEDCPTSSGTPATGSGELTVMLHDIFYEPTELTIPGDTDVVITLVNVGATEHTFSINSLGPGKIGIGPVVLPGQTQEVEINAAAGEYEYYCQVPGHKAAGMVGTLIVT